MTFSHVMCSNTSLQYLYSIILDDLVIQWENWAIASSQLLWTMLLLAFCTCLLVHIFLHFFWVLYRYMSKILGHEVCIGSALIIFQSGCTNLHDNQNCVAFHLFHMLVNWWYYHLLTLLSSNTYFLKKKITCHIH